MINEFSLGFIFGSLFNLLIIWAIQKLFWFPSHHQDKEGETSNKKNPKKEIPKKENPNLNNLELIISQEKKDSNES